MTLAVAQQITTLLVALLSYSVGWTQLAQARGFSELDDVRGNGSLLVNAALDYRAMNQLVIFPSMKFICNGNITAIRFLAFRRDVINSSFFNWAVGHPQNNSTFGVIYQSESYPMNVRGSGTRYLIKYPPGKIRYHVGDVFALYHSYPLLNQMGKTIDICNYESNELPQTIMCTSKKGYRPLISIETDHPECVRGFINERSLDYIAAATELTTHNTTVSYLRPQLMCVGTSIKKWIIGARIADFFQSTAYIHTHSSQAMIRQDMFPLNRLNTTSHINVYEYEVSPPRKITNPDSHSFSVKSSEIYFQYCTLERCVDQPLVAVDVECPRDCHPCSSGFIEVEELKERARYIPNFVDITGNKSFPELRITQDGKVAKWTFTAKKLRPRTSRTEYPLLIILPSNFTSGDTISCCADGVRCLSSSAAMATEYPNVYEATVHPPVPVKAGDFIAIHQPPDERAAMKLKFVRIPPVRPQEINSSEPLQLHPLVHLHIASPSSTILGVTMATVRPSCTPHSEEDGDNSVSNVGAIAGGVAVGVFVLAFIAVATAVLVVLRAKSRGRPTKVETEGTTNPVYDASMSAAKPSSAGTETLTSQIYAEPNAASSNGRGKAITTSSPPTTSSEAQYSEVTGEYAQLTETNTRINTLSINTLSNAEYFLTCKHPPLDTADQNHYEFAIYVPTKEQREQLIQDETSLYSTLEEAQIGGEKGQLTFFEECENYWDPALSRDELYAQLASRKYREIPSHLIRATGHLGSGQFGTVNRGVWQDGGRSVQVAIKKLKEEFSVEEAVMFLQEAAVMGQFRHPNIVQLHGVVTLVKPVMIVTELAHNGNLRDYLLSTFRTEPGELPPPETGEMLVQFCVQVARGMEYLSGKAFVHRDLAARNILITETKTCKISDFGLSRDLNDSYYVSKGGQIPIKWTAPEALHYKKYSTASDVWSFGCLMYEIWSLGHKPFEGYTNVEAVGLVDRGQRLAPPPGCPEEMYRLMILCWNADKAGRPQFREVVETLSQPDHLLLLIPEEVTRGHPQASVLGAPLEAARNLYTQLQNTYIQ